MDGIVKAGEIDAYGRARCRRRDLDAVERQPELFGRDLLHRRLRPGADVLHGRDDRCAPVGAEPDPRVRRRAAAAVPDLRGEADAVLPGRVAARTHLGAPRPVLLGALVALHQVLR
jgi:hypothetical protein